MSVRQIAGNSLLESASPQRGAPRGRQCRKHVFELTQHKNTAAGGNMCQLLREMRLL